ncbi:MAG: hypothetical protein OEW19_16445 [Acidobacteriota bacterium]|nr:hypothetical protein [Acidobacteriota bacterium]
MNARLTKIESGLSAMRRDFRSLRKDVSIDVQRVETRLRVLIEESRAETRTLFDGLRGMIERLDGRLEEMNRSWKTADGDREKALANHARRITTLERRVR